MSLITIPNTFAPGTTAKSAEVNANFTAISTAFNATAVQTDVAKTIAVAHTFSVAQVFTLQQAFAGGLTTAGPSVFGADVSATDGLYDLGKSGAGRFRDAFFSRNVTVAGTLGVTGISTLPIVNSSATVLSVANTAVGQPFGTIAEGVYLVTIAAKTVGYDAGGLGLYWVNSNGAVRSHTVFVSNISFGATGTNISFTNSAGATLDFICDLLRLN